MTKPALSVVIPAYNERLRIDRTLDRILTFLRCRNTAFEIVLVDDCSRDGTAEAVLRRGEAEIVTLRLMPHAGKGAAVRCGVMASRGAHVMLTDADLSTPIEELPRLEALMAEGFDIACGSRALDRSLVVRSQPFYRREMGNIFNVIIRALGLTRLRDTQCGFKLYRGDVAREIFTICRTNGFAFDVESLLIATRRGYRTAEIPVEWSHVPESRVRLTVDAGRMLWDVLLMRVRLWSERMN